MRWTCAGVDLSLLPCKPMLTRTGLTNERVLNTLDTVGWVWTLADLTVF
jgi:hypothetical protein